MSTSKIEWTERTWNPIVGCSIVSPGCTNCYAMKMAARIEAMGSQPRYAGTTRKVKGNAIWTGKMAQAPENTLLEPLRRKKPTTYFVNSMGDLFHEDCPDEWIDHVFAVMALSPQHTYQVLTKRAERMRDYMTAQGRFDDVLKARDNLVAAWDSTIEYNWPPQNVWLGVSTERQQEADERIPLLLQTPAAVRFISAEPMLGPIDLDDIVTKVDGYEDHRSALECDVVVEDDEEFGGATIDWVITGGESGPNARPMHPDWARSLRNQCHAADVPFFFKQWGAFRPLTEVEKVTACGATLVYRDAEIQRGSQNAVYMLQVAKKAAGRLLDGVEHSGMPEARR